VTLLRATDRLLACTKKAFQRGYLCQPTHIIAGSCSTGAAACVPQPLCPWLLHSRALFQRYTVWKFLTTYAELFASKTITTDNHENQHFLHNQKRCSAPPTYRSSLVAWRPLGQVHRLEPRSHRGSQSLVTFLVIAALMPEALSRLSWSAVPGALAYASVMFLFVLATKLTTAANAVFLHYTTPIHIALIGPWLLGERTRWRDWVLIGIALGGVALFFCDQLDLQSICGVIAGLVRERFLLGVVNHADAAPAQRLAQSGNPAWQPIDCSGRQSLDVHYRQARAKRAVAASAGLCVARGAVLAPFEGYPRGQGPGCHADHHGVADLESSLGDDGYARTALGLVVGGRLPSVEHGR
jgi:hypothetical protein